MIKAIIVCEGEAESEVYEFETEEQLGYFASGLGVGADLYGSGSGSCGVYTRDDLERLDPKDEFDQPIIEAIEKKLPASS